MITIEEAKIREKMQGITNKWKDKPQEAETPEVHVRRVVDRMIFRNLTRQLEKMKFDNKKEDQDTISSTEKLFGS